MIAINMINSVISAIGLRGISIMGSSGIDLFPASLFSNPLLSELYFDSTRGTEVKRKGGPSGGGNLRFQVPHHGHREQRDVAFMAPGNVILKNDSAFLFCSIPFGFLFCQIEAVLRTGFLANSAGITKIMPEKELI
jgi:hypothetical protein